MHGTLDTPAAFGDIFWKVIERLGEASVPALRCNGHGKFVTVKVLCNAHAQ